MSEVKLLPMPEKDNDVAVDGEGNEAFFEFFTDEQMESYARANMKPLIEQLSNTAHALAAQTEQVKYYKAENERLRTQYQQAAESSEHFAARAERLAEALRLALKWAEVLPTGEPLRAESVRDLDNARAALDQEGGNG